MEPKGAKVLTPAKFRHLRVTEATSRFPERDTLILLLGMTCGMRATEVARKSKFKTCCFHRARFVQRSVGPQSRRVVGSVYLTHPKTVSALECYLNHRIARGMGAELTAERYRGLAPSTCLVLAGKGRKFAMNALRRINEAGEQVDYSACDSLLMRTSGGSQSMYKEVLLSSLDLLIQDAGIRGGSSHSGRRSFASNLIEQGHDIETVQQLLGHASGACSALSGRIR